MPRKCAAIDWTDHEKQIVRDLWMDGFTSGEIARSITRDVTATNVSYLANKLDLPKRTAESVRATVAHNHRLRAGKAPPPLVTMRDTNVPAGGPEGGVSFEEMAEANSCRWPLTRPDGEIRFCGCDREPGRSYCRTHLELSIDRAATAKAQAKDGVK